MSSPASSQAALMAWQARPSSLRSVMPPQRVYSVSPMPTMQGAGALMAARASRTRCARRRGRAAPAASAGGDPSPPEAPHGR